MPLGDEARDETRRTVALDGDALLEALTGVALAAGRVALGLPAPGSRRGRSFEPPAAPGGAGGATPRVREVLLRGLAEIAPGLPTLYALAPTASGAITDFFLIDPADGSDGAADDAEGSAERTVDIALVRGGAPVVGVVYAPALGRLWAAKDGAAWRADVLSGVGVGPAEPIRIRPAPEDGVTALTGRASPSPELDAFLREYRVTERRVSSIALKFCLLAEGSADLYPQLARSMAWSTAAGDAILRAAGGRTVALDGAPLRYAPQGGEDALANPQFVALGSIRLRATA